jgi:hypothetical protein
MYALVAGLPAGQRSSRTAEEETLRQATTVVITGPARDRNPAGATTPSRRGN